MFSKRTVREFDIDHKKVLLRADYNVPLTDLGQVADDYRIKQSLPTIRFLQEHGCKIVICSHLGRPKGPDDIKNSLKAVQKRLAELLEQEVFFAENCVGEAAQQAAARLEPGQVLLLENLRYHKEEEANDENFAKELAGLAEVFVQDGFGVVHRAHASTDAVTRFLPSVAGLLLEREVDTITNVMENPQRPLMAIVGGAKISDKIEILNKFIDIADFVAVGGAMANTFLLAQGFETGKSLTEPEDVQIARDIMEKAKAKAQNQPFVFYLPHDAVVATAMDSKAKTRIVDWRAHVFADVEHYPQQPPEAASKIASDEMILDIGPFSGAFIAGGMQLAKTVVWNGAMGVTEVASLHGPVGPFSHGTELIVDAMLGQFGTRPFSLVGGGDTVSYIEAREYTDLFNHVSTGGGASLELMAGRTLPGVAALLDRDW